MVCTEETREGGKAKEEVGVLVVETTQRRRKSQVTGNVGLYYVCYKLSRLGWNAMPTARNAKGVDIIAYDEGCTRKVGIQVKTLSARDPVPLGKSIDSLMGDLWIIVNDVDKDPCVFIMKPQEVQERAHRGEKDGRVSFWLQPKSYETDAFRDKWERLEQP
jgi:hypothetical protein